MSFNNPVIIIDDDPDDCEIIQSALLEIVVTNKQKCFENGNDAFYYLNTTSENPVLILSDINMPILNGFKLKQKLDASEKLKEQIPFIFLSTSDDVKDTMLAYKFLIQGYFKKPNNYEDWKNLLYMVTTSWIGYEESV